MTDNEYASLIYCRVFNADSDDGDAYTQGILNAVGALDAREQEALNSYYRYGNTFRQTAKILGDVSNETARQIVNKAIIKLKHPYKSRYMSIKAMDERRKKQLEPASADPDTCQLLNTVSK